MHKHTDVSITCWCVEVIVSDKWKLFASLLKLAKYETKKNLTTNTHCAILNSSKAIETIWGSFQITDFKFNRRQNRSWTTPGASLLNVLCSIDNNLIERFVHIKSIEWFVNRTWAVGKNVSETFLETKKHFGIVFRNINSFRKWFF